MKERDINIKEEITHDELNYNNFMEFQTDTTRNIELDGALVTQPSKESVDITPQNSLGYSDLKDMSNKQTYSNYVLFEGHSAVVGIINDRNSWTIHTAG